jgi:hypothetical protein
MIDTTKIFEALSQRGMAIASSESAKIATLTLRSNAAYENVLGFNFGIKTTRKLTDGLGNTTYVEDSAEYVGGARVSITDANGKIILPMIPYELLKHAKETKFVDRFVEVAEVRAYDADIYVRFEFPPTAKVDNEDVRFMVDATALYSKRSKTI